MDRHKAMSHGIKILLWTQFIYLVVPKMQLGGNSVIAIKGGRVLTMTGKNYDEGTVLINENIIVDVYQGIAVPQGARVVEARGMYVLPGLIDAHCHLGIVEEIYRLEGDDCNEVSDPATPHLRAIDAINPGDVGFADALSGGVTMVVTGPGSANVLGGEMAAIKTRGDIIDNMIIKAPVGMKAALGENPKRSYGSQKKPPFTRMASAAILRENLAKAVNYMAKQEKALEKGDAPPDRDLKMEALSRVFKGEIPLRIHAHRADDIMTGVRIAQEFNIKIVIEHCTEGYKVARELAHYGVPAVIGPVITNRAKVELMGISLETAGIMARAGVKLAIMTDHPVVPIQYLALSAGLTVRGGLGEEAALKAITLGAAQIVGLDKRLGSLEQGKDADLALFSGHPFDVRSRVLKTFIAGKQVL